MVDQTAGKATAVEGGLGSCFPHDSIRSARCSGRFSIVVFDRCVSIVDWRGGAPKCESLISSTAIAGFPLIGGEVYGASRIINGESFVATDHGLYLVGLESRMVKAGIALGLTAWSVPVEMIRPRQAIAISSDGELVAVVARQRLDSGADCVEPLEIHSHVFASHTQSVCSAFDCMPPICKTVSSLGCGQRLPPSLFCSLSSKQGVVTGWHWPSRKAAPTKLWCVPVSDVCPSWDASDTAEAVLVAHPPRGMWLFSLSSASATLLDIPTLHARAAAVSLVDGSSSEGDKTACSARPTPESVRLPGAHGSQTYEWPRSAGLASMRPVGRGHVLVCDARGDAALVSQSNGGFVTVPAQGVLCVTGDWMMHKSRGLVPAPWLQRWRRRELVVRWRFAGGVES